MYFTLSSGRRMYVDVEGADLVPDGPLLRTKPVVVLIHGSEVDHAFFKPWVTPLAADAQLVFVDLIGHGRSDEGEPADWTLVAWADAVAEVCVGLGIDAPIVLGSSLGGRIAMTMALRHSALVAGLVIVSSVSMADRSGASRCSERSAVMRRPTRRGSISSTGRRRARSGTCGSACR